MQPDRMWDQFQMGFWHPFGPYTGQTTQAILKQKRREISQHGWTFWSFAYSPTADIWLHHLREARSTVYALCSHSPGAHDPGMNKGTLRATHYHEFAETEWRAMPGAMNVTNPFKRRGLALAFKVRRVIEPLEPGIPPLRVAWFRKRDCSWRSDALPTRGEFLLQKRQRASSAVQLRAVEAILELVSPYLVVLKPRSERL